MDLDYGEVFQYTLVFLGFFFPLWPLVIASALQRRRGKLGLMLFGWVFMALFRIGMLFSPVTVAAYGIPEPWNTALFLLTGLALVGLLLGRNIWKKRALMRKADRAEAGDGLMSLSPSEFEDLAVELYEALGHKARRTGSVGDHGVDVVVQASTGEKWIVQCKRWRGIVGEAVIRDFYGVLHHEKAHRGAILTSGTFSFQARQWARGKPIELVDGDELLRMLKQARKQAPRSPATKIL